MGVLPFDPKPLNPKLGADVVAGASKKVGGEEVGAVGGDAVLPPPPPADAATQPPSNGHAKAEELPPLRKGDRWGRNFAVSIPQRNAAVPCLDDPEIAVPVAPCRRM